MGSRDSSTAWEQRKVKKKHNDERFEEHVAVSGRVGQQISDGTTTDKVYVTNAVKGMCC